MIKTKRVSRKHNFGVRESFATMETKVLFSCLFVLFSLCLADNIDVSINGETAQAIIDENFICATIDWWPDTECNFGYCSWIKSSVLNIVRLLLFLLFLIFNF